MTTTPPSDESFNKLLPRFEQCFLFLQFPDTSFIPEFLNSANISQMASRLSGRITGQLTGQLTGQPSKQTPDHRDDSNRLEIRSENPLENRDAGSQTPAHLSNFQPDLAVKETFMQNSFSPHNPTDHSLAVNSRATYGAVNQSPESRASSEPSPIKDVHRQKVVSISSTPGSDAVENAREISALYSELKLMSGQISSLTTNLQATQANLQVTQADLQVAQVEIQVLKQTGQRTHDHVLQFEQQQKQAAIKQSQIRLAQEQQLERRLYQYAEDVVKKAMHSAMERFLGRIRSSVSSVVPESAKQPSTYSVPNRLNTGIYS